MALQRLRVSRAAVVLGSLLLLLLLTHVSILAQGEPQPRTVHNACAGSCVADVIFLHAGMGDTQARNMYHAWFGSYYELTGCGDPAWKTDIAFLLDIVGDAVGAPGAPTMQCWQGLAAQASLCSDTCSDYFIEDARYGPNVALDLTESSPGYLEVTLDNASNLNKLPELQPNAYSRQFRLKTTLQYGTGSQLLVGDQAQPSLSFPNWITRGGLDDCAAAYGLESARCQIVANFATPSVITDSVTFGDGVLYDLSDQIDDLSDANGSFSQDGYIRLLSDGDSVTIQQGPYTGYRTIKTHYLSSGTHTVELIPWDASTGPVTITNHECNSFWSTCWITGTRREADTYVYAVTGPPDKVLEGTYTVEVVADIPHEKDFSDNVASYSYEGTAAGQGSGSGAGGADQQPTAVPLRVENLSIVDLLPEPRTYSATVGPNSLGVLYRLSVPDGLNSMVIRLIAQDGRAYNAFVRRGAIPVPNFPVLVPGEYHCWAHSDASYNDVCVFSRPYPDDYYIFVAPPASGGAFQLQVEWTVIPPTPTVTPTLIPTQAQTPTLPPPLTATPTSSGPGFRTPAATPPPDATVLPPPPGQAGAFTEVEPNDHHATANPWDMQQPFTGQLSARSDQDYVLLTILEPGIYTFAVTDVNPGLKVRLSLNRAPNGNFLDSVTAPAKGDPVDLTFDASAGEQYYLRIAASSLTSGSAGDYRLALTGFIPDPDESNDTPQTATTWDPVSGPAAGYFWDTTTGRYDYFTFIAPPMLSNIPITFTLTNPCPDLRIALRLSTGQNLLVDSGWSAGGQPAAISQTLVAGQRYTLRLAVRSSGTCAQPYALVAFPATGAQATSPPPVMTATLPPTLPPTLMIPTATFAPTLPPATVERKNATPPPPPPPSPSPSPAVLTTITGYVWRLFPDSDPAGVGAASVFVTVNGVEQPAVMSMIDGSYTVELNGVQPGDQLQVRAAGPEDIFEPAAYQWQAEAGVQQWRFDFYSYWGEIAPPDAGSPHRLFGYVRDAQGAGVPGVSLLLQMGTSDAFQVLGPTDANGYYETFVQLPPRVMVTVWVQAAGNVPARQQFFHAYAPENREVSFAQYP